MVKVGEVKRVKIEDIEEMPVKIRHMTAEERALLKRSIMEVGYVEPIQVCYYSDRGKYRIVNGQHRFEVLRDDFKVDEVLSLIHISEPTRPY